MMHFIIITPGFNQLDYLKRCVASVADQASEGRAHGAGCIAVHHHIQDAQSTDGTLEWLAETVSQQSVTNNYQLTFDSEADEGMYDAINKGVDHVLYSTGHQAQPHAPRPGSRASGASHDMVVAWLNCDEQYLPGALKKAAQFFGDAPETEVLFGDALVIRPDGSLLCARRVMRPRVNHILTSYLPVFSAAMFVRLSTVQEKSLFLAMITGILPWMGCRRLFDSVVIIVHVFNFSPCCDVHVSYSPAKPKELLSLR